MMDPATSSNLVNSVAVFTGIPQILLAQKPPKILSITMPKIQLYKMIRNPEFESPPTSVIHS